MMTFTLQNDKKTSKKAAPSKTTPTETPSANSSTPSVTADPAKIRELEEKVTKQVFMENLFF